MKSLKLTPTLKEPRVEGQTQDILQVVLAHHRLSSLDPEQPGALPAKLERRSRPNPFRRYLDALTLRLPLLGESASSDAPELSEQLLTLGSLLEGSLALGGWKRADNAGFGMRRVPSAGNLHPYETYLLTDEALTDELNDRAAVYHYSPFDHALERRRTLPEPIWASLRAACPDASAFIALSMIYWRNTWKYGERSFRLCHLDVGHAVAALDAAAALSDQGVGWVDTADEDLARILGLVYDGPESEDPVCLLALGPRSSSGGTSRWRPDPPLLESLHAMPSAGEASPISRHHRLWPGVPRMAGATRRCRDAEPIPTSKPGRSGQDKARWPREVLHRRRSRSVYEDRPLERSVFRQLLDGCADRGGSSFPWQDLAVLLFVHRVEGLEPGLYGALPADPDVGAPGLPEELGESLRPDFQWRQQPGDPRLFMLFPGDARSAISHLSGGQSAAGDGAFTVLMLARFKPTLEQGGAFAYRRIHWQAGELGHRLYLDGEAEGLGVTGLGGFYDDRLCALLGINDESWRPIYMIAVGHRSGEDPELEPAYAHRELGAEPVPAFDGGYRPPG